MLMGEAYEVRAVLLLLLPTPLPALQTLGLWFPTRLICVVLRCCQHCKP